MNRKEVIQFLERKETYNQVIDIIETECRKNGTQLNAYSEDYFMAGGAVANTLHHLVFKSEKPIINDVDLFYFRHQTDPHWGYLTDANNFLFQTINHTTTVDGYGRVWRGSNGETINMVNSERFDIINKVTIDVHLYKKDFKATSYYKELLNGFDLSCTPVGLDRVNGKIVYTDKFVDFLVFNQIEVIGIHLPLQTLVRLYKKIKELKTNSSNFSTEVSLLQHSFLINDMKCIGSEWIQKCKENKEYKDLVNTYFKTHPYQEHEELFYYTSNSFELKPYVRQFNFQSQNSLISFWDLFVRMKSPQKLNKIITFYVNHRGLKNDLNTEVWDFEVKPIRNNFINGGYFDFIACLGISPNYFDCDFELLDLVEVDQFFNFMGKGYMDTGAFIVSNVKQQLKFIEFFNKNFIDEHGYIKMAKLSRTVHTSTFNINDKISISSLDVETKINAFKRMVNNLWIKPKNSDLIKHKINKKIKTHLGIDFI